MLELAGVHAALGKRLTLKEAATLQKRPDWGDTRKRVVSGIRLRRRGRRIGQWLPLVVVATGFLIILRCTGVGG
jgi:hypothetical protein